MNTEFEKSENMDKDTWKKVLNFVIEVLKLVVAGFLGAKGATM